MAAAYGLYTHIQSNRRRSIALLLGLFFAAQEGMNLGGMRRLADQAEQGHA